MTTKSYLLHAGWRSFAGRHHSRDPVQGCPRRRSSETNLLSPVDPRSSNSSSSSDPSQRQVERDCVGLTRQVGSDCIPGQVRYNQSSVARSTGSRRDASSSPAQLQLYTELARDESPFQVCHDGSSSDPATSCTMLEPRRVSGHDDRTPFSGDAMTSWRQASLQRLQFEFHQPGRNEFHSSASRRPRSEIRSLSADESSLTSELESYDSQIGFHHHHHHHLQKQQLVYQLHGQPATAELGQQPSSNRPSTHSSSSSTATSRGDSFMAALLDTSFQHSPFVEPLFQSTAFMSAMVEPTALTKLAEPTLRLPFTTTFSDRHRGSVEQSQPIRTQRDEPMDTVGLYRQSQMDCVPRSSRSPLTFSRQLDIMAATQTSEIPKVVQGGLRLELAHGFTSEARGTTSKTMIPGGFCSAAPRFMSEVPVQKGFGSDYVTVLPSNFEFNEDKVGHGDDGCDDVVREPGSEGHDYDMESSQQVWRPY